MSDPVKRNRIDPICLAGIRIARATERFFNTIKQCGGIATRYDKLAANYLAFVKLASIFAFGCVLRGPRPS